MCGLTGLWRPALSERRCPRRGGAPHGGSTRPSRSRRQRCVDRRGRRPRPRTPPAFDRRSLGRRSSADALGQRALRHYFQRRDLQLSRPARGAGERWCRACVARSLRHRGHARRLRALGHRRRALALRRHVRVRAVGFAGARSCIWRATASERSRSTTASPLRISCSPPSSRRCARFGVSLHASTGSRWRLMSSSRAFQRRFPSTRASASCLLAAYSRST